MRLPNAAPASMTNPPRKLAFVLAATEHGTMIVNRFDEYRRPDNSAFGVGFQLAKDVRRNFGRRHDALAEAEAQNGIAAGLQMERE